MGPSKANAHVTHPTTQTKHPVVIVPGGHSVPFRRWRGCAGNVVVENAYYIRRPGPASEMPRSADEWSALVRRCVLADRESLLQQLRVAFEAPMPTAAEKMPETHQKWIAESKERFAAVQTASYGSLDASPLKRGTWMAAYSIEVCDAEIGLPALRERLQGCVGGETGWPIGLFVDGGDTHPYPAKDVIENWLGGPGAGVGHSDFWRAHPGGHFVTFRGYRDDELVDERRAVGTRMDF